MIKSTFTDGESLFVVIPSHSNNGVHIVAMRLNKDILEVTHHCERLHYGNNTCSHIQKAVQCFTEWKWWVRFRDIKIIEGRVHLQADWEQIPVPASIEDIAFSIGRGDL